MEDRMSDEEFVRQHWSSVRYQELRGNPSYYSYGIVYCAAPYSKGSEWLLSGKTELKKAEAWSAARAITEHRLEEIRQVEEEIEWVRNFAATERDGTLMFTRPERIINRLESILSGLRKGMRS